MKLSASRNILYFIRLFYVGLILSSGYIQAQVPVSSFTVSASQGCKPMNIQFTNVSQFATSYQWNFGNGNTSTQTNPSNIYTTPGTFTITLIANGPGGTNSSTKIIQVMPAPVADFNANKLTACQGYETIQFQNNSTNYDSCVWDFGDGTKSYLMNPSHNYPLAGTFSVNLIVYNKALGCSDFKTRSSYIVINPQPTSIITADTLQTCDLQHVFSFNAQPLAPVSNWIWSFGDTATSALQNVTHAYNAIGNYTVNLITQNNFGCSDTAFFHSTVKVLDNPIPQITSGSVTGCTPFNVTFYSNTISAASWIWSFGNGDSASTKNASCLYDSAGIYNGTLSVVYLNGCKQQVLLSPVSVDQSPVPSFSMANAYGCAPLSVSFTNQSLSGNFTWYWDFGDGTTSTQTNPVHVYDSVGYYIPSLVATSPNGCTKITRNNWYYVTVNGPTAVFSPDVNSGCNPLTVNFTDHSLSAVQWFWNFGDGGTSTLQHPSHIYNSIGSYQVRLVVLNSTGCSDTFYYPSNINVNSSLVNFIPPAPVSACAPHTVHFADASGASAWLWDFGDGTTSTLANPNHTYIDSGIFTVSLTTWFPNGGCSYHISNFQTFYIDAAIPGFTYTVSNCPPYEIFFTDTSKNAAAWSWGFGDGGNSILQNPSHIYPGPGSYDVSLSITTPGGCKTTLQTSGGVQFTGLGANASFITTDTIAPITVQFHSNSTNANYWIWSFGDGDSSFISDPVHTFSGLGPYSISLIIGNDSCDFKNDYPPVTFGGAAGSGGSLGGGTPVILPPVYHCAPYKVIFNNPFVNSKNVLWNFGDGATSTSFSTFHIYNNSGIFQPSLISTDSLGSVDTLLFSEIYYVVSPITDFNISSQNTCNGLNVSVSTNVPAKSYYWNLGNGNTSTADSVTVAYPNVNASYVISLNAIDTNTCSSFVAKSFALISNQSISSSKRRGCAGDSIYFSTGNLNYAGYLWNFGDGNYSSLRNPVHVYQDSGLFQVTLAATDINNCITNYSISYPIEIFDPEPNFTFTPPLGNCTYVYTQFTNTSTNSDSWIWNFGDGNSSTLQDPVHVYYSLGYHNVTLTAIKNICSKSIVIPNVVYVANLAPDFNYVIDKECIPSTATFTDLSEDAVKWSWDFGDGDSSSLQHPVHIYTKAPKNSIRLTVTDVNGCMKSVAKPVFFATKAAFTVSDTVGCNPLTIAFGDSSGNAISWQWDFGDGSTSTTQHPVHSYTKDGKFNVQLIVQSSGGCYDTIFVDSLISTGTTIADFSADSTSGCVPMMVNFLDQSQSSTAWTWDFGDGSTSNLQNPSHVYTTPGIFTVKLIVENNYGCQDTLIKTEFISIRGSIPSFVISGLSGCIPYVVSFTDNSQGAVGWNWNFGDGTTDNSINPVHVYSDSGSFTVSLYTIDSTGCSSIYTLPTPVTVAPAPKALFTTTDTLGCAPYNVHFDNSGSIYDTLIWLMGDGSVLYGNNPVFTYSLSGIYYVKLIAVNAAGCRDTFSLSSPVVVNMQPQAGFVSDITEGCMPLVVQFINSSTDLNIPVYHWDFGNGDTSDSANPTYIYSTDGVYSISLTITNSGGCSSTYIWPDLITVFDQQPPPPTSLYRVTVNNDHEVELNWQLCNLRDMNYYVVYKLNPTSTLFDSIAQIYQNNVAIHQNMPSYIDYNVNTLTQNYTYKVQAVDFCNNRQPLTALRAHTTMNVEATAGNMKVDLQWSPYSGCMFEGYEIYRQDNLSGPFQFIATVDSSLNRFVDSTAWCPMPYAYKIKAVSICNFSGIDSWSDTTIAHPTSNVSQQKIEVVRSTVVNNRFVLTEWKAPKLYANLVDRYNIYRSIDQINYTFIASVPAMMHEFSDYEADVDRQEYYYKVEIQNICSTTTLPGRINSSILLKAISDEIKNTIKWTRYIDWDTGVENYVIEKLNASGVWEEVKKVSDNVTEWEEE